MAASAGAHKSGSASRPASSLSDSERFDMDVDQKVAALDERINAINSRIGAQTYANNPEGDIGGIRSRTARQKDRYRSSVDSATRDSNALVRQRQDLVGMKASYARAVKMRDAGNAVLAQGTLKGKPLTKAERREIEAIRDQNQRAIDRLRGKV